MDLGLLIWAVAVTILVVIGVVWVLDLQARVGRMRARYDKLFVGTDEDAGMRTALARVAGRLSETTARTERLVTRADATDATLAHTVQAVGLVRFSAFQDDGGDQSFALALADGEGNGVVISMLYRRGATRMYSKPVQGWLSPNPMGEEEQQALAKARKLVVGHD